MKKCAQRVEYLISLLKRRCVFLNGIMFLEDTAVGRNSTNPTKLFAAKEMGE